MRKFRNKWRKPWLIFLKIALIHYSLVIMGLSLTSSTSALFNDLESVNIHLKAGWEVEPEEPGEPGEWDKSSLKFTGSGLSEGLTIFAVIENKAKQNMKGPVPYEVYWIEKGNPKNGTMVYSGQVRPLEAGESISLYYTPTQSGNYKFKAYQRPGHPGTGELWSDTVSVTVPALLAPALPKEELVPPELVEELEEIEEVEKVEEGVDPDKQDQLEQQQPVEDGSEEEHQEQPAEDSPEEEHQEQPTTEPIIREEDELLETPKDEGDTELVTDDPDSTEEIEDESTDEQTTEPESNTESTESPTSVDDSADETSES